MVNSDAIVWNEVDMIRAGGGRGARHVIYLLRTTTEYYYTRVEQNHHLAIQCIQCLKIKQSSGHGTGRQKDGHKEPK